MSKLTDFLTSAFVSQTVVGWVRHGLTFGGGLLVAQGYITTKGEDALIGIGISLFGMAWSAFDKYAHPSIPNPTSAQKTATLTTK